MAAAAKGVLKCVEICGYCCQALVCVVECCKACWDAFTKVVTCGQGWRGLLVNTLTLCNTEEDIDFKDFDLPVAADQRTLTDMPALILLFGVLIGMMVSMDKALAFGRPEAYYYGLDSWGNVCSYKNPIIPDVKLSGKDMTANTKVLVFDFLLNPEVLTSDDANEAAKITQTTTLCVAACPVVSNTFHCIDYLALNSRYPKTTADSLCGSAAKGLASIRGKQLSFTETNNRCIPNIIAQQVSIEKQNQMLDLYSQDWLNNLISDCEVCAAELTWLTLIAVAFTLVFIAVIQGAADAVCWFCMAMFFVVGVASSIYMWSLYSIIAKNDNKIVVYSENRIGGRSEAMNMFPRQLGDYFTDAATGDVPQSGYSIVFRDASIIVTFITALFTCISFTVGQTNMDAAAALFKQATTAMAQLRWVYLLPILTICSISFGLGLWLHAITALTAVFTQTPLIYTDEKLNMQKVQLIPDELYTNWVLLFELLSFYWIVNFIICCQNFITSLAVCSWYYTSDKEDMDKPMRIATTRLMKRHLGSVAIGSLVVGFLGWMRAPFA